MLQGEDLVIGTLTIEQLNTLVKKVGGYEAVLRLIRGKSAAEDMVGWQEHGDVISFTVTSNGRTGSEWVEYFEENGVHINSRVRTILLASNFVPTQNTEYIVNVLRGNLFARDNTLAKEVGIEATRRHLLRPNQELGCLIRTTFSNDQLEAMGLRYIVVMHDPVPVAGTDEFLVVQRPPTGNNILGCYGDCPEMIISKSGRLTGRAFAYIASQKNL